MDLEDFVKWLTVALSAIFILIGFCVVRLSAKPAVEKCLSETKKQGVFEITQREEIYEYRKI